MKLILNLKPIKRRYTEGLFFYLEGSVYMKKIYGNWLKKYKLHVLIWILFIFYESITIGWLLGVFGNPVTYIAHYSIIISLFYLHAGLSLPWALNNSKNPLWKLPLVLVLEISIFISISFFTDKFLISIHILKNNGTLILNFQYCLKTFFRDLYFIGFATGYYFVVTYSKEKRKTNELEKQRLTDIIYRQKSEQDLTKAQNAYLKAQINPHFLFNTLDFVYHNIVALSPKGADAIITLAEMMRYAIDSDKMGDFIPLGDEIDQVENLVYLNQIRKDQELSFQLQYEEKVRKICLIPLVLLTIVENIFKHGNLNEGGQAALVQIYLNNETFFIETDNLINYRSLGTGNHKGLSNTEQRLKYAYGDNIIFSYHSDESNHFKLLLGIPLKQLKYPGESSKLLADNDI